MFEFVDVKYLNIIDIPSLVLEKNKITCIIGSSGSGKTSLLKMLNKLISPTSGIIYYNSKNLFEINSTVHRRYVSMLSQVPIIFAGDVRDNLLIGLKYQNKDIPDDTILQNYLNKVQLFKNLNDNSQTLSGGEKQRLALARILLLDADVYLLDEPSSALDDEVANSIINMLVDFVKTNNKTLIMVAHSLDIANKYSDSIIQMHDGKCLRIK